MCVNDWDKLELLTNLLQDQTIAPLKISVLKRVNELYRLGKSYMLLGFIVLLFLVKAV